MDPTNFDVVYASAATGGLWKSVNGGDTWTPLTDYLPRLASGSVAIDPTDPNTIYYGEGECNFSGDSYPGGGIFKSTDGGQSWQQLSINTLNYTSRVIVAPSNHNIVYVGGYRDIYKSTDAGQDWVELNLTNGAVNGIAVNPTDANVIYAGKGSLWGGADTSYGVFKSTDGGSSWTKLNNGLPGSSYCGRVEIALSPSTPNVLYVGIWGSDTSRVFRSSDGGSSWTPLSIGNYGGGQGWYNNCVSVSPQDPNSVFVGGIDFWHTTNGGTNWTNLTQSYAGGYIHPDQHAIAFAPSNPNVIYIGNDGGVWKSTDGGRTFINCNSNLAITQFYRIAIDPENPLLTYGGTQDNGTLKNTQPSLQWDMIYGGDGGQVIVDPKNSNIIYAEYVNGALVKSTDGGNSWVSITNGITEDGAWITPLVIDPSNDSVLYTATNRIYKTTDGGASWMPITPILLDSAYRVTTLSISPIDPKTIWTALGSFVFVTTDGGASWGNRVVSANGSTFSAYCVYADPSHEGMAYVGTYANVLSTTDYGQTWEVIASSANGFPNVSANAVIVDSLTGFIYAGTDVGVYRSTDDGASWSSFNENLPNCVVADIAMQYATHSLVIGTHGRSAFAYALPNPVPVVASISPDTATRLQMLNVQISGANFLPGLTTVSFGSDISVNSGAPSKLGQSSKMKGSCHDNCL
ncbi:MAG: hypothetical protein M1469_03145 [Bacteroidetes bacterium]|nr:hypothetical protein [Bacteroidota bacterium]